MIGLIAPYTFFPHKCQLLLQAFDIQSIRRLCHLHDKINDMVLFSFCLFSFPCLLKGKVHLYVFQTMSHFCLFPCQACRWQKMQVKNHLHIKEGNLRSHKAFCLLASPTFDGKLYNVVKDELGTFTPMSLTDPLCRLKIIIFFKPS